MRQIVLDTETTGLTATHGHRIIEIGCIELIGRRATGRHFHQYLNPERDIDPGAVAIHGLTRERLASAPRFAQVAAALLEFIAGSELIIHNAEFDVAFLDMELARLAESVAAGDMQPAVVPVPASAMSVAGSAMPAMATALSASATSVPAWPSSVRAICRVLDTLGLARERHPGQRNSLDALCKRYGIDNSHRELHGALLDARLLADVYLAMTGGQSLLALDDAAREGRGIDEGEALAELSIVLVRPPEPLRVIEASAEELAAHAQLTALLQKSSGGRCLWLSTPPTDTIVPLVAVAPAAQPRAASAA